MRTYEQSWYLYLDGYGWINYDYYLLDFEVYLMIQEIELELYYPDTDEDLWDDYLNSHGLMVLKVLNGLRFSVWLQKQRQKEIK